jgi:hypothetical protein
METRKKELQEFKDKLEPAFPQDRENLKKEFEHKKTPLKGFPRILTVQCSG